MNAEQLERLVLITIGNILRSDDGIAEKCCENIPSSSPIFVDQDSLLALIQNSQASPPAPESSKARCRLIKHDLGLQSSLIGNCLQGNDAAILIDAMHSGEKPGTVRVLDLKKIMKNRQAIALRSSHGISILDELRILENSICLPERIIFFGIEIESAEAGQALSPVLSLSLTEIRNELCQVIVNLLKP